MSNESIENTVFNDVNDNPASQHLKRFMAICANSEDGIMQFAKFALDEDHLIVLCEPEVGTVFALNLVTTARFPVKIDYDELRRLIDEGNILLAEYTFDKKTFLQEDELNDSLLKRMNERHKAISPLILDLDNSLKNGYDSGTFAQAAKDAKRGVRYIYDTCLLYTSDAADE